MKIALIAAVANHHVIGADNKLIWHLPADLQHFKNLTMGHTLVMGRKTFESIGKPLPGRRSIVITRNRDFKAPGCETAFSLEEALQMANKGAMVYVVGGADLYHQTINLPQTKILYITRIFACFEGDAFFPSVEPSKWKLVERTDHKPDAKNLFPFTFLTYHRK